MTVRTKTPPARALDQKFIINLGSLWVGAVIAAICIPLLLPKLLRSGAADPLLSPGTFPATAALLIAFLGVATAISYMALKTTAAILKARRRP